MGTRIEAVATSVSHGRLFGRGALHLTDVAAESCLARGHHRADELDLLINVGLYKDHSVAEPALASIIQEDLGANPGHPPRPGRHGTFSFDVLNGGCGVLTAAHLLDGFLASNAAHLGIIVAGDSDPNPRTSRHFPFSPSGGALLLGRDDGATGFEKFLFRTFPSDIDLFEIQLRWDAGAGLLRRGRNVIEVYEAPEFAARCIDHGREVARELLDALSLAPGDIDLFIGSTYPRSFAIEVARGLGIADDRVPKIPRELVRAHTAGPIAALEAAFDAGQLSRARHTLFVTAGAGITIGATVYRHA